MSLVRQVIGVLLCSGSALATIQIGELSMAGSGCREVSAKAPVSYDNGVIQIPTPMVVKRASGEPLRRVSCNFVLPIGLGANEKLVVSQLMAPGFVNLGPGTKAQINLEIFKSGARGDQLLFSEQADNGRLRKPIFFEKEGLLFESQCGESFNLRGNTSLMLSEGMKRSTASLDLVQLQFEVKNCN